MPRSPLVVEAKNAVGAPVASASVQIVDRHSGALSTVYSAETGGSPITNPLTADAAGRATCWAERGDYRANVSGTGITSYSIPLDAAASAAGTVISPWITSGSLPTATVGKSIISTTETTTSTSYTTLTTPDQVTGLVVPTAGIIGVMFTGVWQNTVASNGKAAIFVNSNQLRYPNPTATILAAEATTNSTVNDDDPFVTVPSGMFPVQSVGAHTPATTGEAISYGATTPICWIMLNPGTYTISVRFKNVAAGTLTVKNRKLWVFSPGMFYG